VIVCDDIDKIHQCPHAEKHHLVRMPNRYFKCGICDAVFQVREDAIKDFKPGTIFLIDDDKWLLLSVQKHFVPGHSGSTLILRRFDPDEMTVFEVMES